LRTFTIGGDIEKISPFHNCSFRTKQFIINSGSISRNEDIYEIFLENTRFDENSTIIFSLINRTDWDILMPVKAKSNTGDSCSPGYSCDAYEKLIYSRKSYKFSLFANFTEIPGRLKLTSLVEKDGEEVENIASDFSYFNIAICFVPMLLSIPPISCLDNMPDIVTICWVIITDISSAIPLLLKGIELIDKVKKRPIITESAGIGARGGNLEILEYWNFTCRLNGVLQIKNGVAIILIALWVMIASSFIEFLCWRRLKSSENGNFHVPKGYSEQIISAWDLENRRCIVPRTRTRSNAMKKWKRKLIVEVVFIFLLVCDTFGIFYFFVHLSIVYFGFLILLDLVSKLGFTLWESV